ncbi:MAG: dienelactone hydrolase family protein [Candidatus Marinimicrobia bacterium]|nr:dienelactone hydrolase family protein [Candidatus Neomarinimicrobiota bacterium]
MIAVASSKSLKINYFQDSESPTRAVIGLHGWTGDEHSMVPVAKSMKLENTKWYIPRAPYTSDAGKGFTWFSGNDEIGWKYEKTFELTTALITQVIKDGFAPKDIYLIGFSMGAGLSFYVALSLDFPLGGIIPIAGFINHPDRLFANATDASRKTPILILHGTEDDIVKPELGEKAYELLIEKGYRVRLEKYKAPHKIPTDAKALIKNFMDENEKHNGS